MPTPLFIIPLDRFAVRELRQPRVNEVRLIEDLAALALSPALGELDLDGERVKVFVEYKDFRTKFSTLTGFISVGMRAEDAVRPPPDGYATPEYATRATGILEDSRDAFRAPDFVYPAADSSLATGITPQMDQSQGLRQVMQQGDGMCLATSHDDMHSKQLLHDAMDRDDLFGNGPGLLFIEEMPTVLQADLDDYLARPGNPMSSALRAKITQLDEQIRAQNHDYDQHPTSNWESVLSKAQEKGVKVYGIDGGDADAGVLGSSDAFAERRDVKMNKLAADVMRRAKAEHPTLKFVASIGAAHGNTHEGGVPGLGQIFDVPVLRADAGNAGKLVPMPEDTTKRGMPAREVQQFTDRYIALIEAQAGELEGPQRAPFRGKLYANARRMAQSLVVAGALGQATDLDALMASPAVTHPAAAMAGLMKTWPLPQAVPADPAALARQAVMADAPDLVDQLARAYPAVLNAVDDQGQTVLHWAARVGRADCITALAACGAPVGTPDLAGLKPVHLAVATRREPGDPRAHEQAGALDALVRAGADRDAVDAAGRTAAHHAALNNNTPALQSLHAAGADLTRRDQRGWTPLDVAVASTKVEAETFFYEAAGQANAARVGAEERDLDTIAALMRATQCERQEDLQRVQAAYERLYAIKELRPVLQLLALDAMGPRDPRGGSGLRICVADADNVGGLYNARSDRVPPNGAYDDGAHVLMVSGRSAEDFAGTLIHEMTHAAVRMVYGDQVLPFGDANAQAAYDQAINQDVRGTALLMPQTSPLESAVMDRISGRMGGYAARYADTAQKTLHQEFIVGIPQLIAQYGADQVRQLAPGLTSYFEDGFTTACENKAGSAQYRARRAQMDDTLLGLLPVPRPSAGALLDAGPNSANTALALIRRSYVALNGQAPQGAPVYQADQFLLSGPDEQAFEVKMARVETLLRASFAEQGLPPQLETASLRVLAIEMGTVIRDTARPKDLDKIVEARARTWTRNAKLQHVARCSANGDANLLSDGMLAEAVVIRAENIAWQADLRQDGGEHLAVDVDEKKHRELVQALTRSLGELPTRHKTDPAALVGRLAQSLAGDKSKGFYRKGEKLVGTRDPDHVSIDVGKAKQAWAAELRVLLGLRA